MVKFLRKLEPFIFQSRMGFLRLLEVIFFAVVVRTICVLGAGGKLYNVVRMPPGTAPVLQYIGYAATVVVVIGVCVLLMMSFILLYLMIFDDKRH